MYFSYRCWSVKSVSQHDAKEWWEKDDVDWGMRYQGRQMILTILIFIENPIIGVENQDDIHVILVKF